MRIIRFVGDDGRSYHGEDHGDGTATILIGSIFEQLRRSELRMPVAKLLAPIQPTNIICIGRNYRSRGDSGPQGESAALRSRSAMDTSAHDASMMNDAALEVFVKPGTSIQNPGDPILMPDFDRVDPQLDCEGELAIVIGRAARRVPEFEALAFVLGYTIANDVTARAFQTPAGPPIWMRGKGFDTFCPLGPAIVTADEISNPDQLDLCTVVDRTVVRQGSTAQMIRSVSQIIAALSRHVTLTPRTVILTGAPLPLRLAQSGIKSGAMIQIEIPGIGRLENPVQATG